MAEANISVEHEQFICPVCLDLLNDPVAIPCGHSYCMSCITGHWNQEDQKGVYSCPQCRQSFSSRPVLGKNTILAEIVEKLKKTTIQAAVPAKSGDVKCDVCTERKNKAVKFCLVCLEWYCQTHFNRHEEFRSGNPHKVVDATGRLQQMICPRHGKQLKFYCRTDKCCICWMCKETEHRRHYTVTAIAERKTKEKHMEQTKTHFQQRIQQRERDLHELKEVVKIHKHSTQATVEQSEKIFTELMCSIKRSRSEVIKLIRARENSVVRRAEELLVKLKRDIEDLSRKNAEIVQLSQTEDDIHFLQSFRCFSAGPELTDSVYITVNTRILYGDIIKSVTLLREKLLDFSKKAIGRISGKVRYIEVMLSSEEEDEEDSEEDSM